MTDSGDRRRENEVLRERIPTLTPAILRDLPGPLRLADLSACARSLGMAPARVLVALAFAVISGPAAAQTTDDFRSQARIRAGGLYLTPTFTLDQLGIETNVFRSPEPERDFVVAVSPGIDAWVPFRRRALLTLSAVAGADYYARLTGERSVNPEGRARLDVPAGRLGFFLSGGYLNTRRRPGFEIDVRTRRIEDEVAGGFRVELLPRLSLELLGRRERHHFDADAFFEGTRLAEYLNRKETVGVATVRWRRTVLSTFTFDTEVREARFRLSPDRDSQSLVLRAGAEFHPRALISGSGTVGVRRFNAFHPTLPDFAGVVALADLSYRLPAGTTLTFTTERDLRYSFERTDPYYVLSQYRVQVRRRLTGPFDVSAGVGRGTYDYERWLDARPFQGNGALARGRRDARWSFTGSFGYRLGTETRAGFQVTYFDQDSSTRVRRRYSGLEAGLVFNYGS